ncbi:hypothetical protein D9757_004808 [Collybiopsis confluens]|uniref:DUF7330 domain-containing protein n=1 Tax=Collybiopsis confluens TaxID=2823264 RepID=A0A8H5HSF4_9AGAR|nr:hypothetical protein D9757_004808 [Collybiopsis confluens]
MFFWLYNQYRAFQDSADSLPPYTATDQFSPSLPLVPSLEIPEDLLVPLPNGQSEEVRSNFHACSVHANVSADLYFLDTAMPTHREKVLLAASSTDGSVTISIRREGVLPAFDLNAGSVLVKIPRTYRGITLATSQQGYVWLSSAVAAESVVFSSAMEGRRRIFFGDIRIQNNEKDDAMVLDARNGDISIYFNNEDHYTHSTVFSLIKSILDLLWGVM